MHDRRDDADDAHTDFEFDPSRVLGASDQVFETGRATELRRALLELAQQATRSIDLVSRHLDPSLLDHDMFAAAVKRLVLGSTRARVRVVVLDPAPLVTHGHRLVALAQRLSSYIELRVPGPEHREFNESWLVADNAGYAHRRFSDRFEATINFNDPRLATHLTNRFDELWHRAQPDPNLRRLHL
ncbi:MAG: hypothetical protein IT493_15585 [Gammaproteobacteria bacterium]|nr:hypothetical protein [Gammaproteobacteria bacterium]